MTEQKPHARAEERARGARVPHPEWGAHAVATSAATLPPPSSASQQDVWKRALAQRQGRAAPSSVSSQKLNGGAHAGGRTPRSGAMPAPPERGGRTATTSEATLPPPAGRTHARKSAPPAREFRALIGACAKRTHTLPPRRPQLATAGSPLPSGREAGEGPRPCAGATRGCDDHQHTVVARGERSGAVRPPVPAGPGLPAGRPEAATSGGPSGWRDL